MKRIFLPLIFLSGVSAFAEDSAGSAYGLAAIWEQGDLVAKTTFLILVLMSAVSWYVIFVKYFEQRQALRAGKKIRETLPTATENLSQFLPKGSGQAYLASKIAAEKSRFQQAKQHIDYNSWVQMIIDNGIQSIQSQLQSGMAILATVGSTAPFVGLFGTVWGIYHALIEIGMTGQASIDKVAGPVGESLLMTAIGLAVAVPAVLGYNWLLRRNKQVVDDLSSFGEDLHIRTFDRSLTFNSGFFHGNADQFRFRRRDHWQHQHHAAG